MYTYIHIQLTCKSGRAYHRFTSLTLGDNIPSLRHCHHSQLIGGTRKETGHIEECGIICCVSCNNTIITISDAVQIPGTDSVERDGSVKLQWSFPADSKGCSSRTVHIES